MDEKSHYTKSKDITMYDRELDIQGYTVWSNELDCMEKTVSRLSNRTSNYQIPFTFTVALFIVFFQALLFFKEHNNMDIEHIIYTLLFGISVVATIYAYSNQVRVQLTEALVIIEVELSPKNLSFRYIY